MGTPVECFLICGVSCVSKFVFLHVDIQLCQHHVVKRLPFPTEWTGHFCQRPTNHCMGLFLNSQFQSFGLILMTASNFLINSSFVTSFEVGNCEPSVFVVLFHDHFGYSGPLACFAFLKDIVTNFSVPDYQASVGFFCLFFCGPPSILKMSFIYLLAFIVSVEKSAIFDCSPLKIICFLFLTPSCFKVFLCLCYMVTGGFCLFWFWFFWFLFFCIYAVCCCQSFLNLQLAGFLQLCDILSHYFFKDCFFHNLFLLSFWDSSYIHGRPFHCILCLFYTLVCFSSLVNCASFSLYFFWPVFKKIMYYLQQNCIH